MKKIRKDQDDKFICEECGKIYIKLDNLSKHIGESHFKNKKEYFDKWFFEEGDDVCKVENCNNKTEFIYSLYKGYKNSCCKICENIYRSKQTEDGVYKKYGVKNVFQLDECKEKIINTNILRYNVPQYSQSDEFKIKSSKTINNNKEKDPNYIKNKTEKSKKTRLENHGDENFTNREKFKQTLKNNKEEDPEYQNNINLKRIETTQNYIMLITFFNYQKLNKNLLKHGCKQEELLGQQKILLLNKK